MHKMSKNDMQMLKRLKDMAWDLRYGADYVDPKTKTDFIRRADTMDWAIKKIEGKKVK